MSCVKAVVVSGGQTLRKCLCNYRIWLTFILVVMFVTKYIEGIYDFAAVTDFAVTPWVFPFIDGQIYIRIVIYLGIILLFCNAPFIDSNQIYVICRCGRVKYAVGQLFAITAMTMIYFLVLMVIPVLIHINDTGFSMDWGDILKTASETDAMESFSETYLCINLRIIRFLSPIQAMSLAYLFHVLTGILLGVVIYCGNIFFKERIGMGVLFAGALVVADPVLCENWYSFSPVSWGQLSLLNYNGNTKYFTVGIASFLLVVLICLISYLCVMKSSKDEIHVNIQER